MKIAVSSFEHRLDKVESSVPCHKEPDVTNLDFDKVPLDRVKRFRDLLRKQIGYNGAQPTALTHEELVELEEIREEARRPPLDAHSDEVT